MRARIATFNLENLGDGDLAARIAALRPMLYRLDADVLCLQEVNAQPTTKHGPRHFAALDALLAETRYAGYARAATAGDSGPFDVHNLVTLSRWPIEAQHQIHHDLAAAPLYRAVTAMPAGAESLPITWDRPVLFATLALGGNRRLHVGNLHLRAPLAAFIAGQKLAPFVWRSTQAWSEGYFIAAMKRTGQAFETRLAVDAIFDREPDALIALAGDFNADARETPVRALLCDPEDTGNPALATRALAMLETTLPAARRYSVLHDGRKLMLDRLLVSPALARAFRGADVLNEGLADEVLEATQGSFHAPVVAEFELA